MTPFQKLLAVRRRLFKQWAIRGSGNIRTRIAVSGYGQRGREHIMWFDWSPATKARIYEMLDLLQYYSHEDMEFTLYMAHHGVPRDALPHEDVTGLIDDINVGD